MQFFLRIYDINSDPFLFSLHSVCFLNAGPDPLNWFHTHSRVVTTAWKPLDEAEGPELNPGARTVHSFLPWIPFAPILPPPLSLKHQLLTAWATMWAALNDSCGQTSSTQTPEGRPGFGQLSEGLKKLCLCKAPTKAGLLHPNTRRREPCTLLLLVAFLSYTPTLVCLLTHCTRTSWGSIKL